MKRCRSQTCVDEPVHPLLHLLRQLPVVEALHRAVYRGEYGTDSDDGICACVNLLRTTRSFAITLRLPPTQLTLASSALTNHGDRNIDVRVFRALITNARIGRYAYNYRFQSSMYDWIARHARHIDLLDQYCYVERPCERPEPIVTADALALCLQLRTLTFDGNEELVNIESLGRLPYLEVLHLRNCYNITSVNGLGKCASLKTLHVFRCFNLVDLTDLQNACCLENLQVIDYDGRLDTCGNVASLRTITFEQCTNLHSLPGFENCLALRSLIIRHCAALKDVSSIGNMYSVETVYIDHCDSLYDLPVLPHSLRDLTLSHCRSSAQLSGCIGLRRLRLESLFYVTNISFVRDFVKLEVLHIHFCSILADISVVGACRALTTLTLSCLPEVHHLPALSNCLSLREINIGTVHHLRTLDALQNACSLRTVRVDRCLGLVDVAALGTCELLQECSMTDCKFVADVSALERCTALRALTLRGCRSLRDVFGGSVRCDQPLQMLRRRRTLYDQRRLRKMI